MGLRTLWFVSQRGPPEVSLHLPRDRFFTLGRLLTPLGPAEGPRAEHRKKNVPAVTFRDAGDAGSPRVFRDAGHVIIARFDAPCDPPPKQ